MMIKVDVADIVDIPLASSRGIDQTYTDKTALPAEKPITPLLSVSSLALRVPHFLSSLMAESALRWAADQAF